MEKESRRKKIEAHQIKSNEKTKIHRTMIEISLKMKPFERTDAEIRKFYCVRMCFVCLNFNYLFHKRAMIQKLDCKFSTMDAIRFSFFFHNNFCSIN